MRLPRWQRTLNSWDSITRPEAISPRILQLAVPVQQVDSTYHSVEKRPKNKLGGLTKKPEHQEASACSKFEHPFHMVKKLLHLRNIRYRGAAKNAAQLFNLGLLPIQR